MSISTVGDIITEIVEKIIAPEVSVSVTCGVDDAESDIDCDDGKHDGWCELAIRVNYPALRLRHEILIRNAHRYSRKTWDTCLTSADAETPFYKSGGYFEFELHGDPAREQDNHLVVLSIPEKALIGPLRSALDSIDAEGLRFG